VYFAALVVRTVESVATTGVGRGAGAAGDAVLVGAIVAAAVAAGRPVSTRAEDVAPLGDAAPRPAMLSASVLSIERVAGRGP